jgi:putative DNA primase/helicase
LFDFTPSHKAIITTNHKPIVRGTDEGIWRRIHLIAFLHTIPDSDCEKNFRGKKLMPELSGILNWALDGLLEYHRIGLAPPPEVRDTTNEYRKDMDIIGQWMEERCELDPNAETQTQHLYADYRDWAEVQIKSVMASITFGRKLSERGFTKKKVNGGRGVVGLKLVEWERPM